MGSSIAVYRQHRVVRVKRHPRTTFKKTKEYKRTDPSRIVGCHLVSYKVDKVIHTCLIGVNFADEEHNIVLDTVNEEAPITAVLDTLAPIYSERDNPSKTKQREARPRDDLQKGRSYRDGRRKKVEPVMLVFNNLESSLGRLFRSNQQFRRAVRAGQQSVYVTIGEWQLEIAKLIPGGSGCSFEFYARKDDRIIRLVGRSIRGHLQDEPSVNAQSFLAGEDTVDIPNAWSKRQWSSFTPDEVYTLTSHVATYARTARGLYEVLYGLYQSISTRVVGRDGSLPISVAGAGAKIAFSMSDTEEWNAPSDRVTQMGALSLSGGRSFMHVKPGYYEDIYLYDGKSWHGFIMSQLPDPATCKYVDIPPGDFDVYKWLGRHGSMLISGIAHDGVNPPIRDHDLEVKRLRYIRGPFTRIWSSIPEIVIGVVSGRLTVTHIHDGIYLEGGNESSFLRKFAVSMNDIKESAEEGSPLYTLSKLLINAVPGKLAEVNARHPYISPAAQKMSVPIDAHRNYKELIEAYVVGNEELWTLSEQLITQSKSPDTQTTFGNFLDGHLSSDATTGSYYLPMHASQIWGSSSAMLGLAASCTDAIAGYTDSLMTIGNAGRGLSEYRAIVQKAGYDAPENGWGSFQPKFERGHGWISKAGQWVIKYQHVDKETGEVTERQKAALHGLDNIGDGDPWTIIQRICEDSHYSYISESRPSTLMESYRHHVEPGTPISKKVTIAPSSKDDEVSKADVTRSQRLLQETTNKLAKSSSQDIGTQQTALGCIKILGEYGYSYGDIAKLAEIKVGAIKDIVREKNPGNKFRDILRELVNKVEQSHLQAG